jgi:hypothetical protein
VYAIAQAAVALRSSKRSSMRGMRATPASSRATSRARRETSPRVERQAAVLDEHGRESIAYAVFAFSSTMRDGSSA